MKKNIIAVCLSLMSFSAMADNNCDLMVQVVNPTDNNSSLSENVSQNVSMRLVNALNQNGMMAANDYGQFLLVPRFSNLYTETLVGPPAQTAVRVNLTLGVAGIGGGGILHSKSFELRGVGSSEERAYINALGTLSSQNAEFKKFMVEAQRNIIGYFDKNYASLLSKAKRAASQQNYDEALYYSTMIPSCCKGYSEAEKASERYFKAYIDLEGIKLLNAAKGKFATSPNADGAVAAYELLAQINPESSVYAKAMNFADEIKRDTQKEYDFEVHKKYNDKVSLESQRINAMREIGVAYGKGQAAQTTNLLWK